MHPVGLIKSTELPGLRPGVVYDPAKPSTIRKVVARAAWAGVAAMAIGVSSSDGRAQTLSDNLAAYVENHSEMVNGTVHQLEKYARENGKAFDVALTIVQKKWPSLYGSASADLRGVMNSFARASHCRKGPNPKGFADIMTLVNSSFEFQAMLDYIVPPDSTNLLKEDAEAVDFLRAVHTETRKTIRPFSYDLKRVLSSTPEF